MYFKRKFFTKNVLLVKRIFLKKFSSNFLRIFFPNEILLNSLPTTCFFLYFLFRGYGGITSASVVSHCVEKFGKYLFSEVTLYANGWINPYKYNNIYILRYAFIKEMQRNTIRACSLVVSDFRSETKSSRFESGC